MTEATAATLVAEAEAKAARAQVQATLSDLKALLAPRRLADEAAEEIRGRAGKVANAGVSAATRHRGLIAAAAIGTVAVLARRPIVRLFRPRRRATRARRRS